MPTSTSKKIRLEIIAIQIASSLKKKDIMAAIRYLGSEAAMAEAEIVNTSQQAQQEIIDLISRLRPEDLSAYKTKTLKDKSSAILGKMVADCRILAERMITANILSGKLSSLHKMQKIESISVAELTQSDRTRISTLVNQTVVKIKSGADLSFSSLNTLIQNSSIRANENFGDKDVKKENEKIKQEPVSNQFSGQAIANKRSSRILKEVMPTADELEKIKLNPSKYSLDVSTKNLNTITTLRNEYLKHRNESNLPQKRVEVKGQTTAMKVSIDLVQNLKKNGLYAFMDKGGHRWTLESYCVMIARTTATQSSNVGAVFSDEEHDLYYLVPHSGSCPICKKYEGRVYSRSGKDKRYPALASIFAKVDKFGSDDLDNTYLSIHPNCRHQLIKYYPKGK